MLLRYSLGLHAAADAIDTAVRLAIDAGYRTGDIWSEGTLKTNTVGMGDAIIAALTR